MNKYAEELRIARNVAWAASWFGSGARNAAVAGSAKSAARGAAEGAAKNACDVAWYARSAAGFVRGGAGNKEKELQAQIQLTLEELL